MGSVTKDCFVIAVDGPAGAGKSTVARRVATVLGFGYVDSGALYRAAALAALRAGVDLSDPEAVALVVAAAQIDLLDESRRVLLAGEDVSMEIRTPEVSQVASRISAFGPVRTALVALQRSALRPPGIVADGRDIGTVIFPRAGLKVFLDAEPGERARRRTAELVNGGKPAKLADVRQEMDERDQRDRSREVAPLRPAPDAVVIDSTSLGIDEVVARIVHESQLRITA